MSETCAHEWLDRPESDTFECLLCGVEGIGFPPGGGPWQATECCASGRCEVCCPGFVWGRDG